MSLTEAEHNLQQAINDVYQEWINDHGLTSSVVVHSCLVTAGAGFDEDGNEVTLTQIIPAGPHYAMVGLLDEAMTRFRGEILAGYDTEDDD